MMLRRALLRLALRLRRPGTGGLLSALPASVLETLRRDGFDPVVDQPEGGVMQVRLPLGFRGWLVTGYDEARQVLADHHGFSNDFRNLVGRAGVAADLDPGGLGFADPPQHTRMRRLLTPYFTAQRLKALAPGVSSIVKNAVDELERQIAATGEADLVELFALPIPTLTICELLGVPYEERGMFQQLSARRFDVVEGATSSLDVMAESLDYLEGLVRRRRLEPGPGLLGELVADHGGEFEDRELAGLADGLLTGGLETTASMLGMGALILMGKPEHRARLAEDEAFVAPYVEELLRYLSVVQVAFPRFARAEVRVGDNRVRSGDVVLCSLSAAGRDPRVFEHPDRIDPQAERAPQLAFGHGIHRCVGAELARLELRLALPALCRRLPDLTLARPEQEPDFRELSVVYGLSSLPVTRG